MPEQTIPGLFWGSQELARAKIKITIMSPYFHGASCRGPNDTAMDEETGSVQPHNPPAAPFASNNSGAWSSTCADTEQSVLCICISM